VREQRPFVHREQTSRSANPCGGEQNRLPATDRALHEGGRRGGFARSRRSITASPGCAKRRIGERKPGAGGCPLPNGVVGRLVVRCRASSEGGDLLRSPSAEREAIPMIVYGARPGTQISGRHPCRLSGRTRSRMIASWGTRRVSSARASCGRRPRFVTVRSRHRAGSLQGEQDLRLIVDGREFGRVFSGQWGSATRIRCGSIGFSPLPGRPFACRASRRAIRQAEPEPDPAFADVRAEHGSRSARDQPARCQGPSSVTRRTTSSRGASRNRTARAAGE